MKKLCHWVPILVSGVCLLSSCANHIDLDDPVLASPLRDPSMSEIASVKISGDRRRVERLIIKSLDGERIENYQISKDIYQVPPGERRVKIEYFGSMNNLASLHAEGELEVDLRPGRRYVPNGGRSGRNSVEIWIWIEDAMSDERVSDILEEEAYRMDWRRERIYDDD